MSTNGLREASEGDPGDEGSRSPSVADGSTSSVDSKEWEKSFLELQEEFWALQEKTVEVDKYHRVELESLQSKLDKSHHQLERLEAENATLLDKIREKDDEIRYLQVELEGVLADRAREVESVAEAREQTKERIKFITETLQNATRLAKELQVIKS